MADYNPEREAMHKAKWGRMLHMNSRLGMTPWTKVGNGVGARHGSVHYYNLESGESRWTDSFHPEWMQVYSRKKLKYCWVNQFTNDTVWRKPKNFKKGPSRALMIRFLEPGPLKAALIIQVAFRERQERTVELVKRARENAHTAVAGWVTQIWHNPNPNPKPKRKKRRRPTASSSSGSGPETDSPPRKTAPASTASNNANNTNNDDDEWEYEPVVMSAPYYFNGRENIGPLWDKPVALRDAEILMQAQEAADRPEMVLSGWVTCRQKKPNPERGIVWDEEIGEEFYFNVKRGEIILGGEKNKPYDLKAAENRPPEWVKMYDPGKKRFYFYHQNTGDVEWRRPKGYKKPPKALEMRGIPLRPNLKAALAIQKQEGEEEQGKQRSDATAAAAAVDIRLGWVEVWDNTWKCPYWFRDEIDPATGAPETESSGNSGGGGGGGGGGGEILTWDKPWQLIELDMPLWVKMYSPSENEYYYYNNRTGASVWREPDDYVKPPIAVPMRFLMSREANAAFSIQRAYRARLARKVRYARAASAHADTAEHGWVIMPQGYYWCVDTDEVTWELPPALGGGENATLEQEWCRVYAPSQKRYYYYSNFTHQVTWDRPPEFHDPPKGMVAKLLMGKEMRAALTIQGCWRAHVARGEAYCKWALAHAHTAVNGWVKGSHRGKGKNERGKYVWQTWYFYYCLDTSELAWVLPVALGGGVNAALQVEWVKCYAPQESRYYYYSNFTNEVTWIMPEGYEAPPSGVAARFLMSPLLRATLCIQGVWRSKKARETARAAKARAAGLLEGGARVFRGWVTVWDAYAKAEYYFQVSTGHMQWGVPNALVIPKWVKIFDPTTQWHYYVNNDTGEQSTEVPADYHSPRGPHAKLMSMMITNPELRSAMAIQRAFRSRQTRRVAYATQLHRRHVEQAETKTFTIPKDGALGFHLAEPDDDDRGGAGVCEPLPRLGAAPLQYPAQVVNIIASGQAEAAGFQRGDLLSAVAGVNVAGSTLKAALNRLRQANRPVELCVRRRFVPDPQYPRQKFPRMPSVHMGWMEIEFEDAHYGLVRYWWKVGTRVVTIIAPPAFAALEEARKQAALYQPRSPRLKAAFRRARDACDKAPRDPALRMALVRLHIEDGNHKGALKQMERALDTPKLSDPHDGSGEVWELAGRVFFTWWQEQWQRKYLDRAWGCYQKMAQRVHIPPPEALINLARCYEAYGAYEGAALVLGDLIALHKDWDGFDEAVFHAGVLLKHLKQYKDSALYLAYLAAQPVTSVSTETIWFQVAHCYHLAGDDEAAGEGVAQIFHAQRAKLARMNPPITTAHEYTQSPAIWDAQGHELFDRGMYTMAADAFRHSLLRSPSPYQTWPETWANLSLCLHRTCERDQAEAVLLKAIEIHEGNEMLEQLHLKISEEYAAARMAEQRAAIMIQHRFRARVMARRKAKVEAALEGAAMAKAAEMMKHILEAHAHTFFKQWRDFTRYVTGIRKFTDKLKFGVLRTTMQLWQSGVRARVKYRGYLHSQARVIQRSLRAYNIRTIGPRAMRERQRQDAVVKKFLRRIALQAAAKCLVSWRAYVDAMQRARGCFERITKRKQRFCFYAWVDYTRAAPTMRFFGATQFQTQWRGMRARIELRRLKALQLKAAELIQARIRQRIAMVKTKYLRWKNGVIEKKAATKFQAVRRGYLERRRVWRDLVHAAVVIQAAWRSKACRLLRGRAARRIQVAWAIVYVRRLPLRDEAAVPIQALFRGHVARLWLALNRAVTKITAVFRGHRARKSVAKLRRRLRKFWAHLLFSNEAGGQPGSETVRMIEAYGEEKGEGEAGGGGGGGGGDLTLSPTKAKPLVAEIWNRFPVHKEKMSALWDNRPSVGDGRGSVVPAVAAASKTTGSGDLLRGSLLNSNLVAWRRKENRVVVMPMPRLGRKNKNSKKDVSTAWVRREVGPLSPAIRVSPKRRRQATNIKQQKQRQQHQQMALFSNPDDPGLFANTTFSSGWSSVHAMYVLPPEEERPSRPVSAAVERLSMLAGDLEWMGDEESVPVEYGYDGEITSDSLKESMVGDGGSTLEGYEGVYSSGENVRGGHGGAAHPRYRRRQRRQQPKKRAQRRDPIQFPNPLADLRERKVLLSRALGDSTAQRGSAAHVLVGSGDLGLVQSFMKLRAGGKRARAMIGDGLSGGVSPSKAMQTYKKKAGWQ